jgi:DNA-binding Lrp family transcriptional regulator
MENNFFKVYYNDILSNKKLNSNEKLLIFYLKSFQDNNKVCFQTQNDIADILGLSPKTLEKVIYSLKKQELIFTSNDRKYLTPFNNRKAIILVDENNPLPSTEEEPNAITDEPIESGTTIPNKIEEPKEIIDKLNLSGVNKIEEIKPSTNKKEKYPELKQLKETFDKYGMLRSDDIEFYKELFEHTLYLNKNDKELNNYRIEEYLISDTFNPQPI